MIPRIFVSSTIRDLNYLRDGIREVIEDLEYYPVMSDYGEVGYLNPSTAAESCYGSVKQCQMVILIVGERYGMTDEQGMSVTHREFNAARDENIPIITFVDPRVLSFKQVFDAVRNPDLWKEFKVMDNPRGTFQLLDDIQASSSYNGIISFTSVSDAKKKLKLQIAEFVGARLGEMVQPARKELQEVLAQITTIRNQLTNIAPPPQAEESKRYLLIMRYLLEDKHSEYHRLIDNLCRDVDVAIGRLAKSQTIEEFVKAGGYKLELISDLGAGQALQALAASETVGPLVVGSVYDAMGGWAITADGRLVMNIRYFRKLEQVHDGLVARLKAE
jgi:hypothetical protein